MQYSAIYVILICFQSIPPNFLFIIILEGELTHLVLESFLNHDLQLLLHNGHLDDAIHVALNLKVNVDQLINPIFD